MQSKRRRVLTGIQPTGELHVGNYFGALKPIIEFSHDPQNEVFFLCVDWHGLTNRSKILESGANSLGILAAALALGYNAKDNFILLQSDFPQIQENAWYLACASSSGLLERSHAYKDAIANGKEATGGLLFYPALMAADIMSFDADVVPVGKDQAQHLECASDMGKLFNNAVGKSVYKEPKCLIHADVPLVPGTDGRKMSKSYNNHIPLFAPKKEIEKRIKEIKTDSAGLNDPKDPEACYIWQILRSFGSPEAISYMHDKLAAGTGYGYGHAKMDLIAEHERVFGAKRELYDHYLKTPADVWKIMAPKYEEAEQIANAVRTRVRSALGLVKLC